MGGGVRAWRVWLAGLSSCWAAGVGSVRQVLFLCRLIRRDVPCSSGRAHAGLPTRQGSSGQQVHKLNVPNKRRPRAEARYGLAVLPGGAAAIEGLSLKYSGGGLSRAALWEGRDAAASTLIRGDEEASCYLRVKGEMKPFHRCVNSLAAKVSAASRQGGMRSGVTQEAHQASTAEEREWRRRRGHTALPRDGQRVEGRGRAYGGAGIKGED
ncbi:hypothetical protein E2C01_007559 [Portunus trituberculatus]|uniref:Uncharacterized protein n=1 Tax=Portunus trituberculatus TaxID=210409 RepID=A0A5B7D0F9_PORTR|nr:hypothetical protein [Portunus trituberculatus]